MTKEVVWESIDQCGQLARTKTPTGWLVRESSEVAHFGVMSHEHITTGYDWRVTITFVPDPDHVWLKEENA